MTITLDTLRSSLKLVRAASRDANALNLALQDFMGTASDKDAARAKNAAASVGSKMLSAKGTIPREPGQLRMHVESIKQKCAAIIAKLENDKTFTNHCDRAAIVKGATTAIERCDSFIAEYKEMKAGNAATIASAKVA